MKIMSCDKDGILPIYLEKKNIYGILIEMDEKYTIPENIFFELNGGGGTKELLHCENKKTAVLHGDILYNSVINKLTEKNILIFFKVVDNLFTKNDIVTKITCPYDIQMFILFFN